MDPWANDPDRTTRRETPASIPPPPSRLRQTLPEGTRVRVVSSSHEFLRPGMEGAIHWTHDAARLPTFRSGRFAAGGDGVSVQVMPGRDKIEVVK